MEVYSKWGEYKSGEVILSSEGESTDYGYTAEQEAEENC